MQKSSNIKRLKNDKSSTMIFLGDNFAEDYIFKTDNQNAKLSQEYS